MEQTLETFEIRLWREIRAHHKTANKTEWISKHEKHALTSLLLLLLWSDEATDDELNTGQKNAFSQTPIIFIAIPILIAHKSLRYAICFIPLKFDLVDDCYLLFTVLTSSLSPRMIPRDEREARTIEEVRGWEKSCWDSLGVSKYFPPHFSRNHTISISS